MESPQLDKGLFPAQKSQKLGVSKIGYRQDRFKANESTWQAHGNRRNGLEVTPSTEVGKCWRQLERIGE